MKIKSLALGFLLFASPVFAADIDGKWTGTIDTPNGATEVHYTFKAEDSTLTGAALAPDGSAVPIRNGKVEGNKISFSLTLDFGAGPTTFDYTGEVSPTQLKLHTSFMDMAIDMTLKKA